MPAPLSTDLRNKIIEAYNRGEGTYNEIASLFSIGVASVSRFLRRFREHGDVTPSPHGGGNQPLIKTKDHKKLEAMVLKNTSATADELVTLWYEKYNIRLSRSSMQRALKRIDMTVKKKR
jgi:transposase